MALRAKSAGQLKRHKGQRETSAQVAINIIGNLPLQLITEADTLRYQSTLDSSGEIPSASANRTMSDIKGMLTVVDLAFKTTYGEPWQNIRILDKKGQIEIPQAPTLPE